VNRRKPEPTETRVTEKSDIPDTIVTLRYLIEG